MASPPTPYTHDHHTALLAVQRAVLITRRALASAHSPTPQTKPDKTLVSLADYAAQAVLVSAIHAAFPTDTIVGEEDTTLLRSRPELAEQAWDLVRETQAEADGDGDGARLASREDMLHCIDLGGTADGGPKGRVWMIDPVDGTKGFLTGGQYVVCATLLVDGVEQVAVFGCPHVHLDLDEEHGVGVAGIAISDREAATEPSHVGILVSAIRGHGAQVRPLSTGGGLAGPVRKIPPRGNIADASKLRFCENVYTTGPQFAHRDAVAEYLGAPWAPLHIHSTQLRYIALALGACDVVLRMPKVGDAPAHVWDHAGGVLVVEEAGGVVTDLRGKKLDLTTGRDLTGNFGLVAAPWGVHGRVVEAVKVVLGGYEEYGEVMRG